MKNCSVVDIFVYFQVDKKKIHISKIFTLNLNELKTLNLIVKMKMFLYEHQQEKIYEREKMEEDGWKEQTTNQIKGQFKKNRGIKSTT